jgi:hypothetical protein
MDMDSSCVSKRRHSVVEIRRGRWWLKAERIVSAKDFRDNANECMDWARTACSDRERAIFLQMAETWLLAAARVDGRQGDCQYFCVRPLSVMSSRNAR